MLVFVLCPTEHNLLMHNLHQLTREERFIPSEFTKAFALCTITTISNDRNQEKDTAARFMKHFVYQFSKMKIGKIPCPLVSNPVVSVTGSGDNRITLSIELNDDLRQLMHGLFKSLHGEIIPNPTMILGKERNPSAREEWKHYLARMHAGHWALACFYKTGSSSELFFRLHFEDLWLANLPETIKDLEAVDHDNDNDGEE